MVWLAALLLIAGFTLTLRRPRARLWLRIRASERTVSAALLLERGADGAKAARILTRIGAINAGESR